MEADAEHPCQGEATNGVEGEQDHLELVRRLLRRFGKYAEDLFDDHDFGFAREVVRDHIANVEAEIRRLQDSTSVKSLGIPPEALGEDVRNFWNSKKNLRYAAGALMISSRFREEIHGENHLRAIRLKVLYEVLVDTLDDLIDSDSYSFPDALDLLRHCLTSLTGPRFEGSIFREELIGRLSPRHRPLTSFLAALAETVHEAIWNSPHGPSLVGELNRFQENWALGEAYTMYQKDPTVNVPAFLAAASRLPAPDPDLEPWERISGWISHTAALTLLDLCYADSPMPADTLEEHLAAWFYFDSSVTLLNNVMDLWRDLEDGIANSFLIARCGKDAIELQTARGFRPTLTVQDYETFFARIAEGARRCIEHAWRSCEDADLFYPFLAIMAPVVMLADERGIREDLLDAYARTLAPVLRDALAARSRPIATIPPGTRSGRTRAARIASW